MAFGVLAAVRSTAGGTGDVMRGLWALACVLLCSTAPAETREWTASGKKIQAEYVKYAFGVVTLKTEDGKQLRFPLARLSPEDRVYVSEMRKKGSSKASKKDSSARTMRSSRGDPKVVALMNPGETFTRTADGETGITYHVYVPTSFKPDAPPPIIIAFSPTGKGAGMVKALKKSAEKAGWLVAGCDKLRNKFRDRTEKHEDEVLDDILKSIPHQTDRRCLAGMSGGAMRAYSFLQQGRRKEHYFAILALGGWLGGTSFLKLKYKPNVVVAQLNGDNDKGANAWIKRDAEALTKSGCAVRAFKFPGGHVMAPPKIIDEAIAWVVAEREKLEEQYRKRTRRR
ncbi:MAG: SHD1 domain-containing protein [Planctomycetota bacterium]